MLARYTAGLNQHRQLGNGRNLAFAVTGGLITDCLLHLVCALKGVQGIAHSRQSLGIIPRTYKAAGKPPIVVERLNRAELPWLFLSNRARFFCSRAAAAAWRRMFSRAL